MWLDIVTAGIKELKDLLDRRGKNRTKVYEAIEAINRAANRTTIYITKSIKGTYRSQQELSDLWLEAAKAVRELDNKLYFQLLGKAQYWSNPKGWPKERVKKARVSLREIKRESKRLLKSK